MWAATGWNATLPPGPGSGVLGSTARTTLKSKIDVQGSAGGSIAKMSVSTSMRPPTLSGSAIEAEISASTAAPPDRVVRMAITVLETLIKHVFFLPGWVAHPAGSF
jgi:hypothetical protein